ncbi:MAG TPA: respiratory nitrate reductase subunit gamma, partial [Candidatus Dormibacteraeota bacterium]|nr:respiratory nitrate reductase subunit gamma [Candidatus Dormibacteraeota bacterium]
LWVVLPYAAMVLFVAGHIWRYRHDKFGWTSRSTQLLEGRWLAWGSNLVHYGALAASGGHILGILIPTQLTSAVGISESDYHLLSAVAGSVAGIACVVGFVILVARRAYFPRVRRTTTPIDVATYVLLALLIGLGLVETLAVNAFGGGYNYRDSVAIWFRGLLILDPRPQLMATAPIIYQVHAASAWLLYAIWPFSRLVHVWSIPLQYIGRPYILYRRRYPALRR